MRRFAASSFGAATSVVAQQARSMHFPMTPPPFETGYLDSDPLDFVIRQESRTLGYDDIQYMKQLAFVRIYDNPHLTVGEFKNMSTKERKDMWWGCDRPDFYRRLVFRTSGAKEHLYHEGWDGHD